MHCYMLFPGVMFACAAWNLIIAVLGLFPQYRATAVGTLTQTSTRRNYRTSRGLFIPISTKYVYIYIVNGKEYRYTGKGRHSDRRLMPRMPLVYVKGFPRHAYPHKFTGSAEWVMGILMLLSGAVCLWAVLGAG